MEALVGPLTERRRAVRHRRGLEEDGLLQVRIRSGHPAVLLNISAGGALLESESRSAPGTAIELIFEERDRQFAIKGRVLRSAVTRVLSNGGDSKKGICPSEACSSIGSRRSGR